MELLKTANGNLPRTPEQKEKMIEEGAKAYAAFLTAMGFDYMADDNSKDTPRRYAKSFIEDLIVGSISEEPVVTNFPSDGYEGIIAQTGITVRSLCAHHHREVYGKCHIGYISQKDGRIIGLSKLNRIAQWYGARPQTQESMTKQIHDHINKVCEDNLGVIVVTEAAHSCVKCRGVKDESRMFTAEVSGLFKTNEIGSRDEFYRMIDLSKR